ncbi:MAG: DUF3987 domain-containing protein [Deltaproteobacteria bacterium]|nr:DUF3987 domain-containing protein [Deltaproteobacteria bacterium]
MISHLDYSAPRARHGIEGCEAVNRNNAYLSPGLCPVNGADLLSSLFEGCQGYINVRALRRDEPARSEFNPTDNLQWLPGVIGKYREYDLYFGVATREHGNGKKEGIIHIPAVWADIDFKNTPQDKADRLLSELPVKPSVIIESGGGYHVYWFLKEPAGSEDIPTVEVVNRKLASFLEADSGVCDASHILRMPGTLNHKYSPARTVTVKDYTGARYNLEEFDFLPEVPENQDDENRGQNPDIEKLFECSFIKWCSDKPEEVSEPLWYAMVSNVARVSPGGPDFVHGLSRGYPGYSKKETDQKILHALNSAGPHTCQYIKENGYDCGQDCGVKCPINLLAKNGSPAEWPELVPLNDSKAPEIPDNILPGWAGDFTREAARSIQIPYPMALASVLGAVSMAVSSVVKCIHVGPGHIETPNVYLFAPLLSGERKTGMVGAATVPLYEWETEQAEFKAGEIRAAQSRRKTQEKIIEGMRNKAAKTSDVEERRTLIESIAAQEVALEDIPHLPRLLADDATPESLPRILKAQGEVLGIISSEGGIFDIFGGRYSRDGIPNLDLLLKAHSGEPYRVDRIGRDSIVLSNPRLVVCICPQPDVLLSMADKPGFRGRGLLARFLYLFSESQVGYRNITPDPMPESVTREYSTRIKALLDMRGANLELTISPAARALWLKFAQAVEEQMRPGGEFEHFRDWAGKLPGQAARLAGVFHCIEAQLPNSLIVSDESMSRALSLAALLADHAKVAFSTMGSDPATEVALAILGWIQRKERDKFTLRDCFRDLDGRYKNTSELKPGLAVLIERGYIKDIGMEQTGGRPKGPYFVANPAVIGGDK